MENTPGEYDCAILSDVLEHVPEPGLLLSHSIYGVAPGGMLFISVPTPRYPKVFGRQFHDAVGHLVDGYDVDALLSMMPLVLSRLSASTTPFLASLSCFIFYRLILPVPFPAIRKVLTALINLPPRWEIP